MNPPSPHITLACVEQIVHELVVALLTRQMHHEGSEYVRTSVRRATETIADAAAFDRESSLRIQLDGEGVSFDRQLLVTASLQADPSCRCVARAGSRPWSSMQGSAPRS
ncbi:MAG: hypothetical protein IPM13_18390 [Phycisphaerales bacterium]|nr:hypothetical protein [Phycisphaerales bacterium]